MSDYYVHLIGNNKSYLSAVFSTPIQLSDKNWEVALLDASLSKSWNNLDSDKHYLIFSYPPTGNKFRIHLDTDRYDDESGAVLRNQLNERIRAIPYLKDLVNFRSANNGRILKLSYTFPLEVYISPELREKFSIDSSVDVYRLQRAGERELIFTLNLNANLRRVYFFCDRVPIQYIGDRCRPILGSCPVSEKDSDDILTISFSNPIYVDFLATSYLDEIHVYLTDENGNALTNKFSHSYCFVHLREKT